ncbi:MAG TPA: hypothetical protein VNG51_21105 [Ktedonobacteraceae bacterium]|nr:hypothetical protein [Ktedonobacteraceae bacterium]
MSTGPTRSSTSREPAQRFFQRRILLFLWKQNNKKHVRILLVLYSIILAFGAGVFVGMQVALPKQTSTSQPVSHYPAFFVSTPPDTPQANLPYTARNVYAAIIATRIKMTDVTYSNGWGCCITYQPEGKMIVWEEGYGVVLEIATFATPGEAKTDAHDLLKSSAGYSVYTRNLCLFFYDHSISQAHLTDYMIAIAKVCT